MENNAYTLKTLIVATFSAISAFLGWYGWLLLVWIFTMILDWITGSFAAWKNGEWCSKTAREGIFHKGGSIIVVCSGYLLDILVWVAINTVPELNIHYPMYISAVIMIWYTVTELGSIVENAGKLGAPVPQFLVKGIKVLKCRITKVGNKAVGADNENGDKKESESSNADKDSE